MRPFLFAVTALALGLTGQAAAPAGLHPVVLIFPSADAGADSSLVLGAWENRRWLKTKAIARRFPSPSQWRVQTLDGRSALQKSNAPLIIGEEPCKDTGYLKLAGMPQASKQYQLATSPALKTRPRLVQSLPTNNTVYRNVVKAELVRRGIKNPLINITSVTRADLDGDGTQEVIVAASHFTDQGTSSYTPPPHAKAGDYSLLLLRSLKNGQVQTTVLGQSVFVRDEKNADDWQMPTLYDLAGIADLNGDGRMELVMTDAYYEGSGAAVLEWTAAGGPKERLSDGCGV